MASSIDLRLLGLLGRNADHLVAIAAERDHEKKKTKIHNAFQVEVTTSCGRLFLAFTSEDGKIEKNSLGEKYRMVNCGLFPEPSDDEDAKWDIKLSTWRPFDVKIEAAVYGSFVSEVAADSQRALIGKKEHHIRLKCIESNKTNQRYEHTIFKIDDTQQFCRLSLLYIGITCWELT